MKPALPNLTSPLGPEERQMALQAMTREPLDLLVVGGGVVGAGAALDAAARGLRVGLVEARDYAAGASSRSSRLIHGGLRYLEQLDVALVREALRERSLILNHLAPHLTRAVPFLYPLRHRLWERLYVGSGVLLYDTMSGRNGVPSHQHLSRRGALEQFAALRPDALVGAVKYYDGQVDDARYTMTLARTAAHHGALCATSAPATRLLREGQRVVGAEVADLETGDRWQVRARQTLNTTGPWAERTQALGDYHGPPRMRTSKGVHLVVPRDRIDATAGLITRTANSVLFVIPYQEHWLIGTTDTEWALDLTNPAASRSDIDYLLAEVNRLLVRRLSRDDVTGVYAGLRPLLAAPSENTSRLSREHTVATPLPGMVTVAGGKFTTYRTMAKEAVDAVARALPGPVPASCTYDTPLLGADGFAAAWNRREKMARSYGIQVDQAEHLLRRHGSLVGEVLALIAADSRLGRPMPGAPGYLRVDAYHAVLAEGARHLDDVLTRRTRISTETPDRGTAAAPEVARLVAPLLGWDENTITEEVRHYRARVTAEQQAHTAPDDETANVTRLRAVDIRRRQPVRPRT